MREINRTFEVVREEMLLIANDACPACYSGDQPTQDEDGRWWHEGYDETEDGVDVEDRECDACSIRDALARIALRLNLPLVQ